MVTIIAWMFKGITITTTAVMLAVVTKGTETNAQANRFLDFFNLPVLNNLAQKIPVSGLECCPCSSKFINIYYAYIFKPVEEMTKPMADGGRER